MRSKHHLAFWLLSLQLTAAHATEVLFEQPPIPIGNPASTAIAISSTQSNDPDEPRAKMWDNFSLTADATISALKWQGAFNNEFNPNAAFRGDVDFIVSIFKNLPDASPDLSSTVFFTILDGGTAGKNDGVDVSEFVVPNALQRDGGAVVRYEADLDFALSAGEYWLSIVAAQTFPSPHPDDAPNDPNAHLDPTWAWVVSAAGDQLSFQYDELFDSAEPGFRFTAATCPIVACDASFSLIGTAVPEPTGLTLLGIGAMASWCTRRKVRRAVS